MLECTSKITELENIVFLGGTDSFPIGSMYGILIYIHHNKQSHVGKYTIHGWYGFGALKTYLFLAGLHKFGSTLRKEKIRIPGYGNPKFGRANGL